MNRNRRMAKVSFENEICTLHCADQTVIIPLKYINEWLDGQHVIVEPFSDWFLEDWYSDTAFLVRPVLDGEEPTTSLEEMIERLHIY